MTTSNELRKRVANLGWEQPGVAGSTDYPASLSSWVSEEGIDAIVDLIRQEQVKVLERVKEGVQKSVKGREVQVMRVRDITSDVNVVVDRLIAEIGGEK